jgi:cysteinyl-tRNA synthetase
MATLHELARTVNRMLDSGQPINHGTLAVIDQMFSELGGQILGIIPDQLEPPEVRSGLVDGLMDLILSIRQEYRAAKDWARADAIRQRLAELGIIVEDRPEGPTWRLEM